MSLDDLIKQSKTKPKGGAPSSSGPTRRAAPPAARAAPYPPAGPKAAGGASPYGVYSEHVAAMAGVVPRPRPPPAAAAAAARSLETGTKLHISNLDPGVTVDDVQELFSEIGELKRYSVNYDKDGKSQGTAEVVFARKVDALEAIKRYDGVILDGNPMKIDLIGNNSETSPMPPTAPLLYNPPFPNYPNRSVSTVP
jgi:THO complex subunit 4